MQIFIVVDESIDHRLTNSHDIPLGEQNIPVARIPTNFGHT